MLTFDDASLERLRELLASRPADELDARSLRRAAVLVPLLRGDDGWTILFSRRADNMRVHSGQVAFPGGSAEPGESVEQAVLRETEEEIGIPRASVELIGRLDDVVTRTGYVVAPVVGVVESQAEYLLQTSEVVEVFEVPVDALLATPPMIRYVTYQGTKYPAYSFRFGTFEIWGLTGRMLKSFLDLLRLTTVSISA